MQRMLGSIRQKLFFSHIASIAFLALLVLLVFIDLRFLKTQITQTYSVSKIQNEIHQLTLQEERILLIKNNTVLLPLTKHVKRLNELLDTYENNLKNIFNIGKIGQLRKYLIQYQTLLNNHQTTNSNQFLTLARELRGVNDDINKIIGQIETRQHQVLNETSELVSITLIFGVLFIFAIAFLSAILVARHIINPIRNLEKQLNKLSDDKLTQLKTTSNDRELKSFVSQFNLVIDRHKKQEKLLRQHEKSKAVRILVSGVAHELNNPLSNISTSAQLLMEEQNPRPDLQQQWLEHIDSEIERARKIVRRLQDSVQPQEQTLRKVSTTKLVGDSVMLIHRQLDPSISIDIEDIHESTLMIDQDRFQQVFINLIKNAADAGAQNIWVFGDRVKQDDKSLVDLVCENKKDKYAKNFDSYFLFTVVDDGSGIPEENIPNLFTPFFSTKSEGEGTGLGLYIVNEIVSEHDGCISVKNGKESGCEFLILLPIKEENDNV